MKTNPAARYLVKIRLLLLVTSLAGILGLEFYLGTSFAARIGQTTGLPNDNLAAPQMDLGDLMAAAR